MKKFLAIFTLGLMLLAHYVDAGPPAPPYSLPSQSGNSGKFLTTDGTVESWGSAPGAGVYQPIDAFLTAIAALTPTAGCVMLGGAGDTASCLPGGTTGQMLRAVTSGSPAWTTATFPATATGTGTILRADGTNWAASTSTFADTYAIGTILHASGANTVTGLATGTTGQVLRSITGAAPAWSTATFPNVATGTGTFLRADGTNWVASTSTIADTFAIGTIPVASGANTLTALAAGTANYLLQANGAAAPSWVTNLTIGTLSAGAGGMTVDTDGNVVAKSLTTTRTDSPDYLQVYEATSDGDNSARWMAPAKGTGFSSTNYYRFPAAAPSGGQVMSFPTPSDNSTQGTWVTPLTTSLATNAVDAANSIWAVSNGLVFEGATANDYETTIQSTDPTADRTLTLPDASGTVQLTTKTVVDGSAALVLTSAQVSGTIISNTGQGVNDIDHTLPAAAAGYTFRAMVGEAQGAKYWRFTRSGTDTVCLDGTCEKTYVSIAAPTKGATLDCATLQVALTGMKSSAGLAIGGTKTNIYSAAFTYDAAGTGYAKAEVVAGTAPSAATTPQNKYGAQAFDIGADGTIDAVPCTNIATGFDSAALAIADLPAAAAGHARLGYVTAMHTDAGGFVWATTEFDAAGVTEAYTSAAVYTKPYAWVCNTLTGTWSTD